MVVTNRNKPQAPVPTLSLTCHVTSEKNVSSCWDSVNSLANCTCKIEYVHLWSALQHPSNISWDHRPLVRLLWELNKRIHVEDLSLAFDTKWLANINMMLKKPLRMRYLRENQIRYKTSISLIFIFNNWSSEEEKKRLSWFAAFANFYNINAPPMVNFQLPILSHWTWDLEDVHLWPWWASLSQSYPVNFRKESRCRRPLSPSSDY